MMDFRSMNKLNVAVNAFSGNFLPLTDKDIDLGFVCKVYLMFTWLVKFMYFGATTVGLLSYNTPAEAVQMGAVNIVVGLETFVISIYLKLRRQRFCNLIKTMNSIIFDSEDLKLCIRGAIEGPMKRLQIYFVAGIGSVIVWAGTPLMKLLVTNRFTYYDFTVTAYLPGAPFTVPVFLCGVFLEMIGNTYITAKKTGLDIYISYLITLLTAEYRYVHRLIAVALERNENDGKKFSVTEDLQKCVRHQYIVMEIADDLRELLSLNIGLTYLTCIIRFCILAFIIILIPSFTFDTLLCLMYSISNVIQLYMLCSCVQDLLEASTSITDRAFHEDWYDRGLAVKNMFRVMVMSNQMECRLSAYSIVDLTIPSFASIMNQAYTGCLLLLRIR